ncbi:MAG: hypothetical protein U9O54_04500 [Chloroflexota bacterium]|nr:hypothetical protein [Chloroflexota bacterium]
MRATIQRGATHERRNAGEWFAPGCGLTHPPSHAPAHPIEITIKK